MYLIESFLNALLLTVGIETFVVILALRFLYRIPNKNLSYYRIIGAAIFASVLTLPYLWFVLPELISDFWKMTAIGEPLVTIVEGFYYLLVLRISLPKAMLLSLMANGTSFFAGLVIYHVI